MKEGTEVLSDEAEMENMEMLNTTEEKELEISLFYRRNKRRIGVERWKGKDWRGNRGHQKKKKSKKKRKPRV